MMKTENKVKFAILSLAVFASGNAPAKTQSKPNIVLINIDDMGFMGSEYYETPNLDRLAGQGMIFTNANASAANCTPNRACPVSGQWTPRHDIYTVGNSDRGKSKDRKLIPTPNNECPFANNLIIKEVLKNPDFWQ